MHMPLLLTSSGRSGRDGTFIELFVVLVVYTSEFRRQTLVLGFISLGGSRCGMSHIDRCFEGTGGRV